MDELSGGVVAIVEDHGLVAQTLGAALRHVGLDVHVVDPAGDPVAEIGSLAPDLVLLDLDLGRDEPGEVLVPLLVELKARVLVVSGVTDPVRLAACVADGAVGVLAKAAGFEELLDAATRVLQGESLVGPSDVEQARKILRQRREADARRLADYDRLTTREAAVLEQLVAGRTVKEMAADFVVSVATVRSQVRAVLEKLGVRSQLAAVGRAQRDGWEGPAG